MKTQCNVQASKIPAAIEQQREYLIIQALHLETGSWLIHLL